MNIYAPEEFFSNEIVDGERLNRNNEHFAAAVGQRLGNEHMAAAQTGSAGFARAALAFPDAVNSITFMATVAAANDTDLRQYGFRAPVVGRILGIDLCQYQLTNDNTAGGTALNPIRIVPFQVQRLVEAKVFVSAAGFLSSATADTGANTEDTLVWKTSYNGINAPGPIYSYSYGVFMRSRASTPYPAAAFSANDYITVRVVPGAGWGGDTITYGVTLNVVWQVATAAVTAGSYFDIVGPLKLEAQGHIQQQPAAEKPVGKRISSFTSSSGKGSYGQNDPTLGAGE